MQYYVNIFLKVLPGLLLLVCVIMGIFLIISRAKILQQKRLNKELVECMECNNEMLEEFKKIRHEYNNMLQTIICFIEEEDWDGLNEYKSKLLEKTYLLNKNNLVQLVKIKNKSILLMIYKLFIDAKEAGITLNLTIYDNIANIGLFNAEPYTVMQGYLKYAYKSAIKEAVEINLKISANDMGLSFCFENSLSIKPEFFTSKPIKSEKNIYFNTYLQNNHLIQEILFPFNN